MEFLIVSGGKIQRDFSRKYIKEQRFDKIIAADSGMNFLYEENITPDIIVGDFDSAKSEALKYFESKSENIIFEKLNPVKDDTDTEHAIRMAIKNGAKKITILGGTGSRLDHVLGNISLLGIGLEENIDIVIVDENNRIRMIDTNLTLEKGKQFGEFISLIPFSEKVSGLTLKGFKYNLEDYTMEGHNSLGVSNEIEAAVASISFEEGKLIVVESRD